MTHETVDGSSTITFGTAREHRTANQEAPCSHRFEHVRQYVPPRLVCLPAGQDLRCCADPVLRQRRRLQSLVLRACVRNAPIPWLTTTLLRMDWPNRVQQYLEQNHERLRPSTLLFFRH